MNTTLKNILVTLAVILGVSTIYLLTQLSLQIPRIVNEPQVQTSFGGTVDSFGQFTRNAQYFVGKDLAVKVASSSPNRVYLEIANLSGATTTARAIYCTTVAGGVTDTLTKTNAGLLDYTGFVIQASSSKVFTRSSGIPTQAIYCTNPVSTSTVSVVEN